MLIFIENTPRAYAWGSIDALPDLLGCAPTGEPQAELWLGTHPGSPASVAKATPGKRTLLDLIESDPGRYGVNGGPLPFLLKVLAIGAPLSLQAHPDLGQARAGYAREEAAGIPKDARGRNYGDPNHKPELLVALTEVSALSGFRPLGDAAADLRTLAARASAAGDAGADALTASAARLIGSDAAAVRHDFMSWAFTDAVAVQAVRAIGRLVASAAGDPSPAIKAGVAPVGAARPNGEETAPVLSAHRHAVLADLTREHPGDPGVLVSLLLHLVRLAPGEAIYLSARQLHAYLGGLAVEVMASSDNVLRAGLTPKHVDIAELCDILDTDELDEPRLKSLGLAPGLVAWRPDVPDFQLLRARLTDPESTRPGRGLTGSTEVVTITTEYPLVLIVTVGNVRIERSGGDLAEVVTARRGQSLYVSAGAPIQLSGEGEVFLATVGCGFE